MLGCGSPGQPPLCTQWLRSLQGLSQRFFPCFEQGSRQLLARDHQSPLRGDSGASLGEDAKACEGLVQLVEAHVDFDALLEVAALARVPPCAEQALPAPQRSLAAAGRAVRIGVARDAAFGLYYSE